MDVDVDVDVGYTHLVEEGEVERARAVLHAARLGAQVEEDEAGEQAEEDGLAAADAEALPD